MSEDTLQLVGILDDRDNFHVGSALGADHRIDLIDLRKKSGPCAFTCIDRDFLVTIRQWLTSEVFSGYAALVGGSPPLGRSLHYPRHLAPSPFCTRGIEAIAPDEL
jgi:hypothetical protein